MPLFPELTLLLVFAASLVVYLLLKFFNSRLAYKEKKNYLLSKYQRLRAKSISLQEKLSMHILSSESEKVIFTDSLTYGNYLKYLQKNHIKNLSDKGYAKVKNSNNRVKQLKIAEMLKDQEQKLKEAEEKLSAIL